MLRSPSLAWRLSTTFKPTVTSKCCVLASTPASRALSFRIGRYTKPAVVPGRLPNTDRNIRIPEKNAPFKYRKFKSGSKRVGLIGQKVGILNMYDKHGKWHLLTVIRFYDCHVIQIKPEVRKINNLGYINVQVGAGTKKLKNASLPEIGHCAKQAGLGPKRYMTEFRVTPDAILPPGTKLSALHFIPGQFVDVSSISKGKGFAGVMKRYGFSGMRASHGVSKSHRGLGSTGQCQDPGKVWKGKKMPGWMGANRSTFKMQVVRVDPVKDLIYVRGTVAGAKGGWVEVRDCWTRKQPLAAPFPTHIPSESDPKEDLFMELSTRNYYDPESQTIRPEKDLSQWEGPEMPSIT